MNIVVSGMGQDVGKSSLIAKIIQNLSSNIGVIKTSIVKDLTDNIVTDDSKIIEMPNTDTALFKASGADRVIYLKSSSVELRENLALGLKLLGEREYIIIEGNSVLDHINPDLIIYITRKGVEPKSSAHKAEDKADIVIDSDQLHLALSQNQPIAFRLQMKKIPCYKAHLIGKSLGISLTELGKMLDELGIKLSHCQLGVF